MTKKKKIFLPCAIFLLSLSLLCIRIQYGIAWTDECYYTSLAVKVIRGLTPAVEVWEPHVTGAVLSIPFINAFWSFTGSLDGVVLFIRYCAVFMLALSSIYTYFTLQHYASRWMSLIVCCLLNWFAPAGIISLSYNVFALIFTSCALMSLLNFIRSERRLFLILLALFSILAVQAYPTTVLLLIFYIGAALFYSNRHYLRVFSCFLTVGVILCAVFYFLALQPESISRFLTSLPNLLLDPTHQKPGLFKHALDYLYQIYRWYGLAYLLPVILLTLWGGILAGADQFKTAVKARQLFLLVWLVVAIWGVLITPHTPHFTSFKMVPLALLGPSLFLAFLKQIRYVHILLWVGGCLFSLAIHWGTNTYLPIVSTAFVFSSIAVLVLLENIFTSFDFTFAYKTALRPVIPLLLCGLLFANVLVGKLFYDFEEAPTTNMSAITIGPLAGIKTSSENLEKYTSVVQEFDRLMMDESDRMLVVGSFPIAQLLIDGIVVGPSYNSSLSDNVTELFFNSNPALLPSYVYFPNQLIVSDFNQDFLSEDLPNNSLTAFIKNHLTSTKETSIGVFKF